MHTIKTNQGWHMHFNSDLSGMVKISEPGASAEDPLMEIPGELIRIYIARYVIDGTLQDALSNLMFSVRADLGCLSVPESNEPRWEEVPQGADVMEIAKWLEAVESGGFIDYDGFGYYVVDHRMDKNQRASPAEAKGRVAKEGFTHVAWFNR